MKLEVGKRYKDGNGLQVIILEKNNKDALTYPYIGSNNQVYTQDGRYTTWVKSSLDLVSECSMEDGTAIILPVTQDEVALQVAFTGVIGEVTFNSNGNIIQRTIVNVGHQTCECGAIHVKDSGHSTWCPMFAPFEKE